jgi:hypothetical protein
MTTMNRVTAKSRRTVTWPHGAMGSIGSKAKYCVPGLPCRAAIGPTWVGNGPVRWVNLVARRQGALGSEVHGKRIVDPNPQALADGDRGGR